MFDTGIEIWFEKNKTDIRVFLVSLVTGCLLYIPIITMWITNPDGIDNTMVYKNSHAWENTLGRYGLNIVDGIRGNVINPPLITLICIIYLALICVLLCHIFNMDKIFPTVMMIMFVIASPSVASTLTYYYCADSYFLAYLMNVMASYLMIRSLKDRRCPEPFKYMAAVLMMMFALTLYQAYLPIAIIIAVMVLIVETCSENGTCAPVFRRFVWKCIGILSASVLYIVGCYVINIIKNIKLSDSRGFSSMGQLRISSISGLLQRAYEAFFDYFFTNQLINNSWQHRHFLNIIYAGAMLSLVILIEVKYVRDKWMRLLFAMGIVVFPICLTVITIMAPEADVYGPTGILMMPGMNYYYILGIVLYCIYSEKITEERRRNRNIFFSIIVLAMVVIQCVFLMAFQTCMQIDMNKTRSLAGRILADADQSCKLDADSKVMIYGNTDCLGEVYPEIHDVVKGTTAEYGQFWGTGLDQTNWVRIFRMFYGVNYKVCDEDTEKNIRATKEYNDMKVFPQKGYIEEINGVIVIKLCSGD
jgi:hypothetical protein